MALSAVNNTTAFHVFTDYTANNTQLQKSMHRLSTGVKTAVDDAAGISISERMRSNIRGTASARTNVENTISLLQTTDSWLQKTNDMLARMTELIIESNDATKSSIDKNNIQTEFKELQDEITRITSGNTAAAKFNGIYLFRGGNGIVTGSGLSNNEVVIGSKMTVQVGSELNQSIDLDLPNLSSGATTTIGTVANNTVGWGSIINSTQLSIGSDHALYKVSKAIDHISNTRAVMGAKQNRLENTRGGLLTYEDNLRASESKIRDVDMARESAELARYQVLSQVSNSMLAQANGLSQGILQLVG